MDGSDCVDAALDHAIEYARTYDMTLVTFYVMDVCEVGYTAPAFSLKWVREALLESDEQVLDRVAQAAREAGIEVEAVVTEGMPVSEIIHHADEREVDLAVMGTHDRSDIDRYFTGSVVERVVRGSDAPVLTVRQGSS